MVRPNYNPNPGEAYMFGESTALSHTAVPGHRYRELRVQDHSRGGVDPAALLGAHRNPLLSRIRRSGAPAA